MAYHVGDSGHVEVHNDAETRLQAVETAIPPLQGRTQVLVLATGAPVPGGTPAGTVILRTA